MVAETVTKLRIPAPFAARSTVKGPRGLIKWSSAYPSLTSAGIVLKQASKILGVTRYQLGMMLGAPPRSPMIYSWGSTHGVSPKYLTRLLHLYYLFQTKRLDVQTFDGATYWDTYIPPEEDY